MGITYDVDVLRLIDAFRGIGPVCGQRGADPVQRPARGGGLPKAPGVPGGKGVPALHHPRLPLQHPPLSSATRGFGKNEYVETSRSLVVVTAPGPGSGKMATCLSQLYHEYKRGVKAGYAKFETFPIWNLPLNHPVNLAYEAATADLNDVNMIDPFHLEAYGETAVNYNRDVEVFPGSQRHAGENHGAVALQVPHGHGREHGGQLHCGRQGLLRRRLPGDHPPLLRRPVRPAPGHPYRGRGVQGGAADEQGPASPTQRSTVAPALKRAEETGLPAAAIQLPDGRIVTGKTSSLLGASSACLLNALKALGGISKDIHLISPIVIEPIQKLKTTHLGSVNPRLHTDEILIALSICAATNPTAELAMAQLKKLRGCEAHATVILSHVDEDTFRRLGVNLTCEPQYQSKKLYHK